jgi:hypothetical protein
MGWGGMDTTGGIKGDIELFISLSELEKRWGVYKISLKRLTQFAVDGLLEVRVLCPDFETTQVDDNVRADFPNQYTEEYEPVDPAVIKKMIGLGFDWIERGENVLAYQQYPQTIRRTNFSDMVVTRKEIERFELEHLKTSRPGESPMGKGSHWEIKRHAILCAALQVINQELSESSSVILSRGKIAKINAAKLAEKINDERHRWPDLKDEKSGNTLSAIVSEIRNALKESTS